VISTSVSVSVAPAQRISSTSLSVSVAPVERVSSTGAPGIKESRRGKGAFHQHQATAFPPDCWCVAHWHSTTFSGFWLASWMWIILQPRRAPAPLNKAGPDTILVAGERSRRKTGSPVSSRNSHVLSGFTWRPPSAEERQLAKGKTRGAS
jgi:hypothetical protein